MYADEFNLRWVPTLRALDSPKGQQVLIPPPKQPDTYYGIGAVNSHTGETLVLFRWRTRRRELAELLQALVDQHPTETSYVAWDNADTHEDDEIEAVVRAAARRLVGHAAIEVQWGERSERLKREKDVCVEETEDGTPSA